MIQLDVRTAFIVLICVTQIIGEHGTGPSNAAATLPLASTAHNLSPNQSAVPLSGDDFTDLLRLEDVLMVFNLKRLGGKWRDVQPELKPQCAGQMTEYLRGLKQYKLWAIKSKWKFRCSSTFAQC